MAYTSSSIIIDLIHRGASVSSLTIFTFINYPYSFKIIWAPLLDKVYINRIGRRKTYILGSLSALICLYTYLSFKIDYLLK